MPFHPLVREAINICVTMAVEQARNYFSSQHPGEIIKLEEKHWNERMRILNLHPNAMAPVILPKAFTPKTTDDTVSISHTMWNDFHNGSLKLDADATAAQCRAYLDAVMTASRNHPCSICGQHARERLKTHPLVGTNKKEAVRAIFDFHNYVSQSKQEPRRPMTEKQFFSKYGYDISEEGVMI
jgi:Erv1 / Alr family